MFNPKQGLILGLTALLLITPGSLLLAEEDEALELAPVKKGAEKEEAAEPEPTAVPTIAPTAAPTSVPTATAVPTPRPRPTPSGAVIEDVRATQEDDGVLVSVRGRGPITGYAANLRGPDRVLLKIQGGTLAGSSVPRERSVGIGAAKGLRLAQKAGAEVWVVVDLSEKVAFKTSQPSKNLFQVLLLTGARIQPTPTPRVLAETPKINLMLFDQNVIYQDRQYDRFPCANFIYNASDAFPLKRDFVSTLVFHDGYGAFVGNARILDPQGKLVAQTETPFAFNLFNRLTDFQVELPWKVEFKDKGYYSLFVALNGADVMQHRFYVGHNTDNPPAK